MTVERVKTKHSKAFLPLENILKGLESGQPVDEKTKNSLTKAIGTLSYYAQYQNRQLKDSLPMNLENFQGSVNRASSIVSDFSKRAKQHPELKPFVKTMEECVIELMQTLHDLEKRPTPKAEPVKTEAKVTPIRKNSLLHVSKNGEGWQIGGIIIDDETLAMKLISSMMVATG